MVPLNAIKINDTTVAIEELDKCIAEYDENDYVTKTTLPPKQQQLQQHKSVSNTYIINTSLQSPPTNTSYLSNITDDNNNISTNETQSPKMSATTETIEFMVGGGDGRDGGGGGSGGNRSQNFNDSNASPMFSKSPDSNNNNNEFETNFMRKNSNANNLLAPNKFSKTSLTSSASQPPPPPPPLPPMLFNTCLSLNANSNATRTFLRAKNQ